MELMEKALEASQRGMGSEHPDTLRAMYNLANSYRDLGCYQMGSVGLIIGTLFYPLFIDKTISVCVIC